MSDYRPEPIVAIATAPGRGAVGIVRVSGTGLGGLTAALCGRSLRPREATYLPFLDAAGEPIDRGLALFFPAPHSFTGEDVLELQAHGGTVVLQLLLARCLQAGQAIGLRLAQPGEFTQRAFLNDKLDLAQAEAVADLIDAGTEAAARSAVRSLSGDFSAAVDAVRDALIELRMFIEATLDFPEEEIDILQRADVHGRLDAVRTALAAIGRNARQGALLRDGITAVLAGQPNAGKSSLLNALAGAELAIVSPVAGTTRDRIGQTIQIEGVPLHVVDTAGLRESEDLVEQLGVARAWDEIEGADVVLFLHDLGRCPAPGTAPVPGSEVERYVQEDVRIRDRLANRLPASVPVIDVWNKTDLIAGDRAPADDDRSVWLSARTGDGLEQLRRRLLELAGWTAIPEGVYMARERHLQVLQRVERHLAAATAHALVASPALDLVAEELRLAHDALGEITGVFGADDLLGVIFARFCIGK